MEALPLDPRAAFRRRLLWLLLPPLLTAMVVIPAMLLRRPTLVEIDLELSRFGFTVAGDADEVFLLDRTPLAALGMHVFAEARLRNGRFLRLPPEESDCAALLKRAKGRPLADPLDLLATTAASSALIVELAPGARAATLDRVLVAGGAQVEVAASPRGGQNSVQLGFDGAGSRVLLSAQDPFRLDAYSLNTAASDKALPEAFSLCVQPSGSSVLDAHGSGQRLHLDLSLPVDEGRARLLPNGAGVAQLDFTRQGPAGERLSTLVGAGHIAYPDDPSQKQIPLAAGDYVRVGGMQHFRIRRLEWLADRGALHLQAHGQVAELRVGPQDGARDARLSWFARLAGWSELGTLGGILVWVCGAVAWARKQWKENAE